MEEKEKKPMFKFVKKARGWGIENRNNKADPWAADWFALTVPPFVFFILFCFNQKYT